MQLLILLLSTFFSLTFGSQNIVPITILHTNDLHSYVGGKGPDGLFTPLQDNDPVLGHYARLTTLMKNVRAHSNNAPVITLDAGDFYSGTLFQILTPQKNHSAPEIDFFTYNQYDYTTFGNHEFDMGLDGLANMLEKNNFHKMSFKILSTNVIPETLPATLLKNYSTFNEAKKTIVTNAAIKKYQYKDTEVTVGFMGITGPNAIKVSAASRNGVRFIGFDDIDQKTEDKKLYSFLNEFISNFKVKNKIDIMILLMHGGTPEDEEIAKNVKGLNVIIAGHTHELYARPKIVNQVIIGQTECYGHYIGVLNLLWDGKTLLLDQSQPSHLEANDSIIPDQDFMSMTNKYISEINQLMKEQNYQYESKIFKTSVELKRKNEMHNSLGMLIGDAVLNGLNSDQTTSKEPFDLYFNSLGMVRQDVLLSMNQDTLYQFSDVFKFLPLGQDEGGHTGYPLVSFYLSKEEVKNLLDFVEFYRHFSKDFAPAFSSTIKYDIRSWGIPFVNRLKNLSLNNASFDKWPDLIHVATTSFIADSLGSISKLTYGLLSFPFRDKQGNLSRYQKTTSHEYKLLADYLKDKWLKADTNNAKGFVLENIDQ